MAGADHVSINSKVTMNKLQKINYKGESRYEYVEVLNVITVLNVIKS